MLFSSRHNHIIKLAQEYLSEPTRWNSSGGHQKNKLCIVMCIWAIVTNPKYDFYTVRNKARGVVCAAIFEYFGVTRNQKPSSHNKKYVDIISFNDHKDTTHEDVMMVLNRAEELTRPIWVRVIDLFRSN